MAAGILYGVGVGPGDPELMTLKAVRIIEKCDMIGIPARDRAVCTAYQIALQAVPALVEKPVIEVAVPMTTDALKLEKAYGEGCSRLAEQLAGGRSMESFLLMRSIRSQRSGIRTSGTSAGNPFSREC